MSAYKKTLFPITIYQNNIRENNLLKDKYLPRIISMYNEKDIAIPSGWDTGNVYTSFNQNDLNNQIFDYEIYNTYQKYIRKFFDKEVEFDIVDFWFNCYENGEYQEQHNHLNPDIFISQNAHFACIHYLKFDPEVHNSAVFLDPIATTRYNSLEMDSNRYMDRYSPQVLEGDLIMFPNYLEHFVKQTAPTPGNQRVSISFNISITKYGQLERH